MKKICMLMSVFMLSACVDNGNPFAFYYFDDLHKSEFGATPRAAKKSNSSLTNMETVFDFSDRWVEIYNKSGINIPDSATLPELDMNGQVRQDIYNNMSEEKKLTLRKAMRVMEHIGEIYTGNGVLEQEDLRDIAAWINAYIDVESNGKITQQVDIDEFINLTTKSEVREYFSSHKMGAIISKFTSPMDKIIQFNNASQHFTVSTKNGEIVSAFPPAMQNRVGNVFTYPDKTLTYELFGDSSYLDFGYFTEEYSNGETRKMPIIMGGDSAGGGVHMFSEWSGKYTPDTWHFAGTAVGAYINNPGLDPDEKSHTLTMRTDNATLEVSGTRQSGFLFVIDMPFSDDGWYDVKYTGDLVNYEHKVEFSNYSGTDDNHRLSVDPMDGSPIIATDQSWAAKTAGDHALDPSEVVGWVDANFGNENKERFEAAFGMTRRN